MHHPLHRRLQWSFLRTKTQIVLFRDRRLKTHTPHTVSTREQLTPSMYKAKGSTGLPTVLTIGFPKYACGKEPSPRAYRKRMERVGSDSISTCKISCGGSTRKLCEPLDTACVKYTGVCGKCFPAARCNCDALLDNRRSVRSP